MAKEPSKLKNLRTWSLKFPRSAPAIILVGVAGAGCAVLFHHTISAIHSLIWKPLSQGTPENFILVGFFIFMTVGLLNGFLVGSFAPEAAGSGIPQLKVAYRRDRGSISFRTVWVKFLAAAASVGGGLSLGREGPTVQLAGGMASVIGKRFGLSRFRRRTLTACGAAAGLAAAFNAPIAAVTFVLEEIIEDLNSRTIGPILLASFVSVITLFILQGSEAIFIIPSISEFHAWIYLAAIPVGAVAALAGVGFQKSTLSWMAHIRKKSRLPLWLRPMIGALINWVSASLVFFFIARTGVLGLGYNDLTDCLAGNLTLTALLILFFAKWIATSSAYAWGNSGGIFAPTLFLGAMVGGICSQGLGLLFDLDPDSIRLLTIVGMSACLGAVVRAPITSILIVFEMTHDFALVPPLMLAALISQAISRSLCQDNFYSQALKEMGIHLETNTSMRTLASWRNRRISSFANFDPACVRDWNTDSIKDLLNLGHHRVFPVLNRQEKALGLVKRKELQDFLSSKQIPTPSPAVTVPPDMRMADVESIIQKSDLKTVFLTTDSEKFLGIFTHTDVTLSQDKEKEIEEA
ncbi:MAG: chloride channel protein [Opitutales bacterium]|nr:chloride channel protein [Opitutales bacterium]